MRCPVKVFGNAKLAEAKDWIVTVPAWMSVRD